MGEVMEVLLVINLTSQLRVIMVPVVVAVVVVEVVVDVEVAAARNGPPRMGIQGGWQPA